jgi:hypothetical protein
MKLKTQLLKQSLFIINSGKYANSQLQKSKIDPYTRCLLFHFAAILIAAFSDKNPYILYTGIGIGIAGAFQLTEVTNDSKLAYNTYSGIVFVLTKNGITELRPKQIPNFPIEGVAIKGYNSVFRISDGVYANINKKGKIYTYGLGFLVNIIRNAGRKNKKWVLAQSNPNWMKLYNCSL